MRDKNFTEAILIDKLGIPKTRAKRILENDPKAYFTLKELEAIGVWWPSLPEPPPQKPPRRRPGKPHFEILNPVSGQAILRYKTRRRTVWTDPKLDTDEEKLKELFQFVRQGETLKYMSHTDRILAKKLKASLKKLFKEDYEHFYESNTGVFPRPA